MTMEGQQETLRNSFGLYIGEEPLKGRELIDYLKEIFESLDKYYAAGDFNMAGVYIGQVISTHSAVNVMNLNTLKIVLLSTKNVFVPNIVEIRETVLDIFDKQMELLHD